MNGPAGTHIGVHTGRIDMYDVLLPIDDDERHAIEQVETVLSLPGTTAELSVTVLHVLEEIDTIPDEAGTAVIEEVNEELPEIRDVPASVEAAEQRLADAGIEADRTRLVGDPVDGILETARDRDVDAIVLGSKARSPVGKAVFGSVSQGVILETDRTVIVAR